MREDTKSLDGAHVKNVDSDQMLLDGNTRGTGVSVNGKKATEIDLRGLTYFWW